MSLPMSLALVDASTLAVSQPTQAVTVHPPVPAGERLSHLFRASLRDGRIHPLYLHVLSYRQAKSVS